MNKILVIVGPTAIGKTKLAIQLAKNFGGEIVSADSRQVYQGMNIGTGKDIPAHSTFKKIRSAIPEINFGYYKINHIKIWLYDLVKPDFKFSVAYWIKSAYCAINYIWKRKKMAILTGGTGFYIKTLFGGIETLGIPPDWNLRKRLSFYSLKKLVNLLKKTDFKKWQKMNQSDRNNPHRLIRAIEVAINSRSKNSFQPLKTDKILMIGLTAPYNFIRQKIKQRIKLRIKQGIEKEVKNLLRNYQWTNSVLGTSIGYKEWQPFFERKISLTEVIKNWEKNEYHYARRQLVWFKKEKKIIWYNVSLPSWKKNVVKLVKEWYYK